ncbi:cyclin-dependent kinase [Theileria orientalis]|uniref:Cyclin-dependent kinase n=1 Tax=Theileria orientalis TaxID=68886 RepID=A0A976XK35_THEOR|nr:cyclin-dependent kinase [Theileria orientalis]
MKTDMFLNSPPSSHTFNSLIDHKNKILNSLQYELQYATLEFKLINYLFALNSQRGSDAYEVDESELFKNHNFLKFDSAEFHQTKNSWTNLVNDSINSIKKSLSNKKDTSKELLQLNEVHDSITGLQSAYFSAVQQRENNMKLLLRIKMYSSNRLKLLSDSIKSYQSTAEFKKLYDEPKAKLVEPNHNKVLSNMIDTEYKRVINSNLKTDLYSTLFKKSSKPTILKPVNLSPIPVFKSPNSTKLMNIFTLTTSLDEFKSSAKNIYMKYGGSTMSFNVFNNVVLFLVQSLHLPNLHRIPTDHIYSVYNINPCSILDFRTFLLLYWEVLHAIKHAIEIYYHPRYTFHSADMYLNYSVDEYYPFVNISDRYSFIKRLSPGRSSSKYVAKELKTDELRVIEIFFKTPDLPLFHEIYSEFEELRRFNHKNLVKYIALYHDYNSIYVVTEFCAELSLTNKLSSLDSSNFDYSLGFVHNVFTQLVEALVYLHCNNVTHLSLNPDKIMIDDSTSLPKIKIRDYGFYEVFSSYKHQSPLTTLYQAPEVANGTITPKSNVWTAGMILLFMVTGHIPTHASIINSFVDQLPNILLHSTMFKVEDDLYDLITYILCKDPNLRPSSFDVLSHSWFNTTGPWPCAFNLSFLTNCVKDMMALSNYRNITRFLESSNVFYVNKMNKLLNTLVLSAEPNQPDMVGYGSALKVLKLANVPNNLISEFVHLTSLKDSDKCSLNDLFLATKYWRHGELNILWSVCRKHIDETDWSFNKTKFVELLSDSKTSLLMKEEVNSLCRSLELNEKIYWNHFVNLML